MATQGAPSGLGFQIPKLTMAKDGDLDNSRLL
jgi:hypothetical protein